MGNKSAAVCVLMPAYNHGKYIRQAIESFLAQQKVDARLLIGDDASTDDTLCIAREYAEKFPDRITLYSHPGNLGLIGNYRYLIENSSSRYIAILESDDYWTDPLKLYRQVEYMERYRNCGLVYTSGEFVDREGRRMGYKMEKDETFCGTDLSGKLLEKVLLKNPVLAVTACIRRETFESVCSMEDFEREKFVTFDYPVWLALASCSDFHSMPEVTAAYRVSGSSISNNSSYGKREEFMCGQDRIVEYSMEKFEFAGDRAAILNERVVKHMMLALAFGKFGIYRELCWKIDPRAGLRWTVLRYIPWLFRLKKRKIIGTGSLDKLTVG